MLAKQPDFNLSQTIIFSKGQKGSLCKQIGNAVPPLLAFLLQLKLKKRQRRKNILDLFCGAGGLSLGFGWAGYNVVVANDNFKQACETYRANHKDTVLIEGDITNKKFKVRFWKNQKKVRLI